MKHFSLALCIIMILLMLIGCSKSKSESPQNTYLVNGDDLTHYSSNQSENNSNIKISYFHADWPYYDSLDTLVDASSNVFEGKISNIYFDIIDLHTGEPASEESKTSELHLYTIYEVEVNSSYKGINTDKVYIKVIGGMEGYQETTQYSKLCEYDMYDDEIGIWILDCFEPLTIGKTYLFLTSGQTGPYHKIINNTQFAYDAMESEKTNGFSFNEVMTYVKKHRGTVSVKTPR